MESKRFDWSIYFKYPQIIIKINWNLVTDTNIHIYFVRFLSMRQFSVRVLSSNFGNKRASIFVSFEHLNPAARSRATHWVKFVATSLNSTVQTTISHRDDHANESDDGDDDDDDDDYSLIFSFGLDGDWNVLAIGGGWWKRFFVFRFGYGTKLHSSGSSVLYILYYIYYSDCFWMMIMSAGCRKDKHTGNLWERLFIAVFWYTVCNEWIL